MMMTLSKRISLALLAAVLLSAYGMHATQQEVSSII